MKTNFFDQFKGLDTKNPGSWPAAPKATALVAIFAVVLGAGYYFDTQNQLQELEAGRIKETQLKEEYVSKFTRAINLDLYKQQLKDVDVAFGNLLKQLPDKSKMEALITDVNQSGVAQGLQFELFKPATQETMKDFYAELPISIKVTGTYHQIARFTSEIGQLSRIVTLNDVGITIGANGVMQMEATAKTFRYLSDSELAARQEEINAKKRAEKAKS